MFTFNSVKFELSPNRSDWNLCSDACDFLVYGMTDHV